jgi:hypothetical protein
MILEALMLRLKTLSTTPELTYNDPGYKFDVPSSRKYLRVSFLPNVTERLVIDSDGPHRHYGILQLTVCWPVDEGEIEPRELAGKVADHFSADTKMVYGGIVVRSMKRPTVASSMKDGADLLTPVSVEYESYI